MNVIQRLITRQILNNPRLYRHLSIPLNNHKNEGKSHSRSWKGIFIIGTGLASYEIFKKSLPNVHAAEVSRRSQVSLNSINSIIFSPISFSLISSPMS